MRIIRVLNVSVMEILGFCQNTDIEWKNDEIILEIIRGTLFGGIPQLLSIN